jgi:hypothetical protein
MTMVMDPEMREVRQEMALIFHGLKGTVCGMGTIKPLKTRWNNGVSRC